ncbi:MAG TPA: aspartate/glutamate racemase family protein [Acholeplasma sp.]|jgi:aspartate racemase|nr:aspartate/glutamate racemase family protein [Acholeplasma sp.]
MYKLGIIGGMGPLATAELFRRIVLKTDAATDQEHIKTVVLNNIDIPDRTEAIVAEGKNPVPYLNQAITDLKKLGVEYAIMPCNTAHYFVSKLDFQGLKFINMVDETLKYLKEKYYYKKIIVLSTSGTKDANVYQSKDLDISYADSFTQKALDRLIYQIKEGYDLEAMAIRLKKMLTDKDIVYVLACTELSLLEEYLTGYLVVDAMDVLVLKTIEKLGYKYKK